MTKEKIYNFNPGPAVLPDEVLQQVKNEMLDFSNTGMSILEMSHRSNQVESLLKDAEMLFKDLLNLDDDYKVLFLQGGASSQFHMIPMNFLASGKVADYVLTGRWSEKAHDEAAQIGNVNVAASTKKLNHNRIPNKDEITLSNSPAYVHITTNNTIYGTQWQDLSTWESLIEQDKTLIADMSSDILSRAINSKKFGLIYAGAQKNLGPAGVTVVIINKKLLENAVTTKNSMLNYNTHIDKSSLYNTPPTFNIYVLYLVLKWIANLGGVTEMENINRQKSNLIYDVIDQSHGFYQGHAETDSRSTMNITFTLSDPELEQSFLTEAENNGLIGLKGHRSVGGIRASLYNGMSIEGAEVLAEFMKKFQKSRC